MATKVQAAPKRQADSINIKELLHYFLSKWYWFVISVAVCVAFASYKLLKTQPVYLRTITVLSRPKTAAVALCQCPTCRLWE